VVHQIYGKIAESEKKLDERLETRDRGRGSG